MVSSGVPWLNEYLGKKPGFSAEEVHLGKTTAKRQLSLCLP